MNYAIDVSHHQNPNSVPWKTIVQSASVCICRASYGTTPDKQTANHFKLARSNGFKVGLYTFFRASQPVDKQIDLFNSIAKSVNYSNGDIVPALDIENDVGNDPNAKVNSSWEPKVKTIAEAFKEEYGNCLIYITKIDFDKLGKPAWLLDYPLWTAHYTAAAKPSTPANKECVIWQHRVGPYDANGPGGAYTGGLVLDQNRILGELPTVTLNSNSSSPIIVNSDQHEDDDLALFRIKNLEYQAKLIDEARKEGWKELSEEENS